MAPCCVFARSKSSSGSSTLFNDEPAKTTRKGRHGFSWYSRRYQSRRSRCICAVRMTLFSLARSRTRRSFTLVARKLAQQAK